MAAALQEALGVEAELRPGDKGIFDVEADGTMIFSKYRAGRYPEHEEIVEALRQVGAGAPA